MLVAGQVCTRAGVTLVETAAFRTSAEYMAEGVFRSWTNPKAVQLVITACCPGGLPVRISIPTVTVAGSVDVRSAGLIFGNGTFDDARTDPGSPIRHQVGQDTAADHTDQIDDITRNDVDGVDDLIAGSLPGDSEAGPARPGPAYGALRSW